MSFEKWDNLCRGTFSGVNECQESATDIIIDLERQLEEAIEYMEEHDCLEDFNEWKNR